MVQSSRPCLSLHARTFYLFRVWNFWIQVNIFEKVDLLRKRFLAIKFQHSLSYIFPKTFYYWPTVLMGRAVGVPNISLLEIVLLHLYIFPRITTISYMTVFYKFFFLLLEWIPFRVLNNEMSIDKKYLLINQSRVSVDSASCFW